MSHSRNMRDSDSDIPLSTPAEITDNLPNLTNIVFMPVPYPVPADELAPDATVWRLRLGLLSNASHQFGLELNGELVLGREGELPDVYDLKRHFADLSGVSRRHLMLRPTLTNLYAIDVGSTNGTWRNGRSIGVFNPTPISNGDVFDLGGLQVMINIVERPKLQTGMLQEKLDLAEAMSQLAQAITSQLDPDQVLQKVLQTAQSLTAAEEVAIWLMDESSGELFLVAAEGIEDEEIRQMRLSPEDDNLISQVLTSSQPLRAYRKPGEELIKVKTGYLVESLLFVPISLGGLTFGVIGAGQRQSGKAFSPRDERLLVAIADFAAIAIQNARLYQATDKALARRVSELMALNEVSRAVSSSLDLARVYAVLVEQVNKNWPVEHVQVYLLNEAAGGLLPLMFGKDAPRPRPISEGILWQVAQKRAPIFTNDAPRHAAYTHNDQSQAGETSSIACVPLIVQENVVGVLALFNKIKGNFTAEDMARLEAFSYPVATAVENARLFAESRRQQFAISATARTISEPLIILDEYGNVLVSNEAAEELLKNHMSQLFEGIKHSLGHTVEVTIGKNPYLATSEHIPEVGTISIMQDISYVKQLEQDRAEFMYALSHDMKSPLTSIKGFAELLSRVVQLNEKGWHFVTQIINASERMLDMINHLLQITYEESIVLEQTAVDLRAIIADVIADMEGASLNKRITLLFDITGESYTFVGDRVRLYHLVLNLVDNAVKYSPPDTTVQIVLDYSPKAMTLSVQDEGAGIPEEDLPHLFEKFYRGKRAVEQQGMGLGLSVVAAIAQAHGGNTAVVNHPEGGALFRVTLPRVAQL